MEGLQNGLEERKEEGKSGGRVRKRGCVYMCECVLVGYIQKEEGQGTNKGNWEAKVRVLYNKGLIL